MKPGTIYRITNQSFDPYNDIQEIVDISDNDNLIDDAEDPVIIDLSGTGRPIRPMVIDNEDDPFTVIKSQRIKIEFNSTQSTNVSTFASGSDQRWSVHHYIGSNTVFKGFLSLDDLSEPWMPAPNTVVLTATDGLGLLKDIPLTDLNGDNPVGEYTLGELISLCLYRTGVVLQLRVAFNIKLSGYIDDISIPNSNAEHLFSTCYLNAKSFEERVGKSINCYEVLQRILGEGSTLFQRNGYYYIMRIDEVESATRGLYITSFDTAGAFLENLGEKNFDKTIDKDDPTRPFFSREATRVVPQRALKSVTETFPYEYPQEIPDNKDFDRGDLVTTVSSTEKHYSIDGWDFAIHKANGLSADVGNGSAYIKRIFDTDYEKERYVVITEGVGVHAAGSLKSGPIEIQAGDVIDIGVDFRLNSDISNILCNTLAVELVADDGTFWYMLETGRWFQYPSLPSSTIIPLNFDTDQLDTTSWMSTGAKSIDAPRTGRVYIHLIQNCPESSTEIHFQNLTVTYYPLINGSHTKYTSQSQVVTQAGNFKGKREKQVYVSDSPKKLIKGALLKGSILRGLTSNTTQFANGTSFTLSGYLLGVFRKGQIIFIAGTTFNNGFKRVKSVSYNSGANETTVILNNATFSETVAAEIAELTFSLANEFYNAAVFTSGPPDSTYIHPYSEIQVFDVWNQFAIDRRKFEATLQGLDLGVTNADGLDNIHLIHKYIFNDVTENSGDRIFTLLHYDQDHRNGEWTGVLREVDRLSIPKSYTGREFRYNTD